MTDFAAALYPSMPSAAPVAAPAPAAAPIASPAPQAAAAPAQPQDSAPAASRDAVDKWVPDAIKAERAADTARKMFPSGTAELAKVIDAKDFSNMAPEVAEAVAGELREMARDIGATPYDVSVIRNELERLAASPLTPEQVTANRLAVGAELSRRYGADATAMLNQAREFLRADPRRAQMLAAVGDTPSVVLRVVELARAARTARR